MSEVILLSEIHKDIINQPNRMFSLIGKKQEDRLTITKAIADKAPIHIKEKGIFKIPVLPLSIDPRAVNYIINKAVSDSQIELFATRTPTDDGIQLKFYEIHKRSGIPIAMDFSLAE